LLRQDHAAQLVLPDSVRAKLVRQAAEWHAGRRANTPIGS
jgi:hypothetical protein